MIWVKPGHLPLIIVYFIYLLVCPFIILLDLWIIPMSISSEVMAFIENVRGESI